jgi:hypothetical protein
MDDEGMVIDPSELPDDDSSVATEAPPPSPAPAPVVAPAAAAAEKKRVGRPAKAAAEPSGHTGGRAAPAPPAVAPKNDAPKLAQSEQTEEDRFVHAAEQMARILYRNLIKK